MVQWSETKIHFFSFLMLSPGKIFVFLFGIGAILIALFLIHIASESNQEFAGLASEEEKPLFEMEYVEGEDQEENFLDTKASTQNSFDQDTSFFRLALQEQDESFCHEVTDFERRTECFDRVRLAVALEIQELEICTQIKDDATKSHCSNTLLKTKAIQEKNETLCQRITATLLREECTMTVKDSRIADAVIHKNCEDISEREEKATCVDSLRLHDLRTSGATSRCSEFLTAAGRQKCQDYIFSMQALEQEDPTICLQISQQQERENCEETLATVFEQSRLSANILSGKSEYCSEFHDPNLKKSCENEAHYTAARTYRDTSYCRKIEGNASFQGRCFQELQQLNDEYWLSRARSEQNTAYCAKMSSQSAVAYCKTLF